MFEAIMWFGVGIGVSYVYWCIAEYRRGYSAGKWNNPIPAEASKPFREGWGDAKENGTK